MSHHHHTDYVDVISAKGPQQLSGKMKGIFMTMTVAGFGIWLVALLGMEAKRLPWISFLHNLYYFTGLAAGGMAVAAIMHVARSHWGRAVKRYAEAMSGFLPFSIVGVVILWIGAYFHGAEGEFLYEWLQFSVKEHMYANYHNKAFWLNMNFVFGRQLVSLVILLLIARRFTAFADRTDFGLAASKNSAWTAPSGYGDHDSEVEKAQDKQTFWGVLYCAAFAICFSAFAYDLIMALDFRWISTMFGGWAFTSALLQAWGALVFITWWMSSRFDVAQYIHKKTYHDLGKLTFGFTIVWGYLFFAQVNVIWYGNLGHETGWLLNRFVDGPWAPLGKAVVVMVFLLPFLIGLGKKRKMSPKTFAPVVLISAIGLWLERLLLIAPATLYYDRTPDATAELGVKGYHMEMVPLLLGIDIATLIGFAGLFCLCFAGYLYKRPIMVISDPRLDEGINRH